MKLISNSINSRNVQEFERDGDRHLRVNNVTFVRSTELANGYVPEQHVADSVDAWDGVPLTLNHPRTARGVVSANTSEGKRVTIGEAENPRQVDDGTVAIAADLTVNADRAAALDGGEALVDALERGEGVEVSSQFFGDSMPPGEYDGEHRDRVEGDVRPDSIALLPNKQGVCSLPDCGIAPGAGASKVTANGDTHLSLTAEPLPADAWDGDQGGLATTISDAVRNVLSSRDPPAATANSEGCGCGGTCSESENSDDDEPAESGEASGADQSGDDPTANKSQMVDIDRGMIVQSVAQKTTLDASTLEDLGDDALVTIYQSAVSGEDGDGGGDEAPDDGDEPGKDREPSANSGGVDTDELVDEVAARVSEQLSANNEQKEKAELADDIVANSAEHGEDDRDELMDAPTGVLESLHGSVTGSTSPGLPGTHGAATANSVGADADGEFDDVGTGVISHD